MKKVFYLFSAVVMVAMLASCGGVESDANNAGKKACDCLKAMQAQDKEKVEACDKEMNDLMKKLEDKYKTEEEQKAFQDAYLESLKNCDVDLGINL